MEPITTERAFETHLAFAICDTRMPRFHYIIWKLKKTWCWNDNKAHFVKNDGKVNKAQTVWISTQKGKLNEEMCIYAAGNSLMTA